MKKFRRSFALFLPLFLLTILTGQASAALLDFGPIVPEVVGSAPPNIQAGYPLWFRDTNRVPLVLCMEEVPGCLFAAVDRPDLTKPLAFPNIPDELFYYSAGALIGDQLLFAGVEMNFADNGDGTFDQVGFSRVRIRITTTVPGDYTVTTPWKQYFFNVTPDAIAATGGLRVINATEDIGLLPDGQFAGILKGNIGPYVYSQGAPFVTAAGSFLGDNTPRPVTGSIFPDPNNPTQMANIFRIEGPPGFTTVSTNLFSITGKLYLTAPTPTPLTVDKTTYALDNSGLQVNAFATTEAVSNQTNSGLPFPQNFALTGAPSALQLTGSGIPSQAMTTNDPADGKFFSASGLFFAPDPIPQNVTVTNTSDSPVTVKTVPLVDEVVISSAFYSKETGNLVVNATSYDKIAAPALQAFIPGMVAPLGTLAGGKLTVPFPFTDTSVIPSKTYAAPPASVRVVSAKGGSTTAPVVTFIPVQPAPATGLSVTSDLLSPQAPNTPITFVAAGAGGSGSYEYQFWLNTGSGYDIIRPYSSASSWTWTPNSTGTYDILIDVRSAGSTVLRDAYTNIFQYKIATPATTVTMTENLASPQAPGAPITFTATATGGSGPYEYRFWVNEGNGYAVVQNYGTGNTFVWTPTKGGLYDILVDTRIANSAVFRDALVTRLAYQIAPVPATAVTITPNVTSPQLPGTTVTFTAAASGGTGPYEYRYWINSGGTFQVAQDYTTTNTFAWTPAVSGNYDIMVDTRAVDSTNFREALQVVSFYQIKAAAASGVTATPDKLSPQPINAPIVITAAGSGGSGSYEYRFWLNSGTGYAIVQDYSTLPTWTWFPAATGNFDILVDVRNAGTSTIRDASTNIFFYQVQ